MQVAVYTEPNCVRNASVRENKMSADLKFRCGEAFEIWTLDTLSHQKLFM